MFARTERVEISDTSGVVLVRPTGGDRWAMFEGTAHDIWAALERPRTLSEIVEDLASRYAGTRAQIELDVDSTLREWCEFGIVENRAL